MTREEKESVLILASYHGDGTWQCLSRNGVIREFEGLDGTSGLLSYVSQSSMGKGITNEIQATRAQGSATGAN